MAQSTAFIGHEMTLGIGDGSSSESFVDIAEVTNIDGPDRSMDPVEVTHATSPDAYREIIRGLRDAGEVSLEMNMVQADYNSLLGIFDDSDGRNNYKITIPDDNFATKPTILFAAYVTALSMTMVTDDKVTASATLKISGKPTYTIGT